MAIAIAMALAAQFPAEVAHANSGFGDGVNLSNSPMKLPTFNANIPSGLAPVLTPSLVSVPTGTPSTTAQPGLPTLDGTTNLPIKASSGKALRKFVDTLPGIGATKANNLGQYIPVAVAEKWVDLNGNTTSDDYIEIAAVEYTQKMHSDLLNPTRLRGYVQLWTPALGAKGLLAKPFTPLGSLRPIDVVDLPNHLGPIINATTGTALRVKFVNLLPVGGKLFIPVDTTVVGAGTGPDGITPYSQNRVVMHLAAGGLPWISAGTPHQWIAPATEKNPGVDASTGLPGEVTDARGVSNNNVPDMADPGLGATTLYFPNDISARFTFYHDRASGLTRLNAYAGMEAGYFVSDATEQTLIAGGTLTGGALPAAGVVVPKGTIPGAADTIPLIIEDKTFVPADIAQQDAKWNVSKTPGAAALTVLGGQSDLWFPHVYEPNQDPGSALGTNPIGRFDYGPLFWPVFPARDATPTGYTDDATIVPTAYFDTPVINGTAYPSLTVDPKAYRFRILNASVDRYLNLGLYKADTTAGLAPILDDNGNPTFNAAGVQQFFSGTEVKLVSALAADALGNPPVPSNSNGGVGAPYNAGGMAYDPTCLCQYPTLPQNNNVSSSGPGRAWPVDARRGGVPDPLSVGPDIIAIGNDGGFLPNPVDIPSQPITYEANRRSITVNNAYGYGLLLGPAERSDAIIDFSKYAGQTLIVYNDAPAPFPFSDERNDYYTGNPDLSGTGGAYPTKPGYGPNTRTIMQIKVNAAAPNTTPRAYNPAALLTALPAAYAATQPAPLVPAAAYNAAFGTNDPDIYAHIATGAAAQPTLDFTTTGPAVLTLNKPTLISSGGTVAGNTIAYNTGSGSGYNPASPPKVVFNNVVNGTNCLGANGVSATATAAVSASTRQVSGLPTFDPGSGYTCLPTVSFVNTAPVGTVTLRNGGSGYSATQPPTLQITGDGTGATVTAIVGDIASAAILNLASGGSSYTDPVVTVTGGGTSGAVTGTAVVSTSSAKLSVTGGRGYNTPTITYTGVVAGGNTVTRSIATTPKATDGSLNFTLTTTEQFVSKPTVTIADTVAPTRAAQVTTALTTNAGSITGVTLTPNAGFTSAPTITISDPNPRASGARVTATVNPTLGAITGITFTGGSGYTMTPTISLTDPTGNGSGARVSIGLEPSLGVGAQVAITATGGNVKSLKVRPLAEQELFDNRGRYNYTGGVEMPFTNAINQTTVPLNYIDAATEKIADGDVEVWKITVNGLFSNNLSFNLAEVQLINRVGWDGTVKPPASNELGWKSSVRMNPLEDMLVAIRAKRANVPFGMPYSTRAQDPSKKLDAAGSEMGFTVGQGVTALASAFNQPVNYYNEFFWGSTLLSNAENDFTRPIVFTPTVAIPSAPTNLADPMGDGTLTWTDPTPAGVPDAAGVMVPVANTLANPQNETYFKILENGNATPVALVAANATKWVSASKFNKLSSYSVVAHNEAGDSAASVPFAAAAPNAPTGFAGEATAYNAVSLSWRNVTTNNSIQILRNGTLIKTLPGTATSFVDTTVAALQPYTYQITVVNTVSSASTDLISVTTPITPMTAPTNLVATYRNNNPSSIRLSWTDSAANETAYQVEVSTDGGLTFSPLTTIARTGAVVAATGATVNLTPNVVALPGKTYVFRVTAFNGVNTPAATTSAPVITPPVVSTVPLAAAGAIGSGQVTLTWSNPSSSITRWTLQRRLGAAGYRTINNPRVTNTGTGVYTFIDSGLTAGGIYTYRIAAVNMQGTGPVATSNAVSAQ